MRISAQKEGVGRDLADPCELPEGARLIWRHRLGRCAACSRVGCCRWQQDCSETEDCVGGECVARNCSGAEGSALCPVHLCTGPSCEAPAEGGEPSCSDGARNGSEADVDCGPDCPERCATGSPCEADGDCNGSETSVDCGGADPACGRCPDRAACAQASDCESNNCLDDVCISCGSNVVDGFETDIDCGGSDPACRRCDEGRRCLVDGDCSSGACEGGQCCGGALGDCTRCAERLSRGVDCSGAGAVAEGSCTAFLECLANNPSVCPTRFAPGCSSDPGACNHNTLVVMGASECCKPTP